MPERRRDGKGYWTGEFRMIVALPRDPVTGKLSHLPKYIFMGGERGVVRYSGQPPACFLCGGFDHYRRACRSELCSRCGVRGHRTIDCDREVTCTLCGLEGHAYRFCAHAYVNRMNPEWYERELERFAQAKRQEEERQKIWRESRAPGERRRRGSGARRAEESGGAEDRGKNDRRQGGEGGGGRRGGGGGEGDERRQEEEGQAMGEQSILGKLKELAEGFLESKAGEEKRGLVRAEGVSGGSRFAALEKSDGGEEMECEEGIQETGDEALERPGEGEKLNAKMRRQKKRMLSGEGRGTALSKQQGEEELGAVAKEDAGDQLVAVVGVERKGTKKARTEGEESEQSTKKGGQEDRGAEDGQNRAGESSRRVEQSVLQPQEQAKGPVLARRTLSVGGGERGFLDSPLEPPLPQRQPLEKGRVLTKARMVETDCSAAPSETAVMVDPEGVGSVQPEAACCELAGKEGGGEVLLTHANVDSASGSEVETPVRRVRKSSC